MNVCFSREELNSLTFLGGNCFDVCLKGFDMVSSVLTAKSNLVFESCAISNKKNFLVFHCKRLVDRFEYENDKLKQI